MNGYNLITLAKTSRYSTAGEVRLLMRGASSGQQKHVEILLLYLQNKRINDCRAIRRSLRAWLAGAAHPGQTGVIENNSYEGP